MPRPASTTVIESSGWIVTSTQVVLAGERLVDGVVDDLVDEVVEAPRAGRADVHPGPEPDRLEAFQDRDVLCGVIRLGHAAQITSLNEKSPANRAFRGSVTVYQKRRSEAARARLAAAARAIVARSSSSVIAAVSCGGEARASRRPPRSAGGGSSSATGAGGAGTGAGAKRIAVGAPRPTAAASFAEDLVAEQAELERPRRGRRRDEQRAVAGDPLRPGGAGDRVADRRRPDPGHRRRARRRRARRRPAARRARSRRAAPSAGRHLARGDARGAGPARAAAPPGPVAVTIVCPTAPIRSLRIRRRLSSSSESASSRSSEGRHPAAVGDQLGLGEEQREHGEALLALRAERAQVAVARSGSRSRRDEGRRRSCRARCRGRAAPRAAVIVGGSAS